MNAATRLVSKVETGIAEAYAISSEAMACNMMDEAALDGAEAFIDKRKAR